MKVLYVSSNGGIHDYRFLKKLTGDYEVLFLHYAANEIIDEIDKLGRLQIISKKPAFKSMPLLSEGRHFKKVLKEFQPDIVHTGYVWQVGILAANSGVRPHLSMPWGSDILLEPDKSFILKRLVKKVMKTCDHVQCDSEFVKQKIMTDYRLPDEKITVFPWGIDLTQFKKTDKQTARKKLNIGADKFVLLFNRYFEEVYGIDHLLQAFKIFAEGKEDVFMLMLSDGSMKNEVLKFISEHTLEDKVRVIGRVRNSLLPDFLNSADVYVSSALSDGTSLSLLEAMACGVGLAVTDVPSIKEWVTGENGILARRGDAASLAEAMDKYYNDRNLATEHGSRNLKIAEEKADWDKNYLKLKEIYGKMLA